MTAPLTWSAPLATGYASITAEDGDSTWRITPVPRDVCRISYTGTAPDGRAIREIAVGAGHAESVDEAKIVIDILRAGTDQLAEWQDQLVAAGLTRTYPQALPADTLAALWQDSRASGLFQVSVMTDAIQREPDSSEISVSSTYESDGATFWHNVSRISGQSIDRGRVIPSPLPHGVDALKAGVAAALAIRQARIDRGGRFVDPIGGAPKKR